MISLSKVLEEIETVDPVTKEGRTFSCTVITCDLERDKGGEFLTLHNVRLHKISRQKSKKTKSKESISTPPNEKENATRNLLLPNGQTRKIHIHLIIKFNGQEVVI
ncbi:hypothetical protein V9L05_15290 [Bernardetia sp. Wsw4-3y2]|uniref:hypothetical protein n=1 Tax=Bernardetia sp. Wsw4-3y2 TaxID=3127471 RepID=UPI0030D267F6